MKLKICLSLVASVLFVSGVTAQYDVHFTHYWELENFYNPAAMNRNGKVNIVGSYSMQFAGYTHAPGSMYLGANSMLPFGNGHHAAGIGLMNETVGLFSHRRLFFNYSYKVAVGSGFINIGGQAGLLNESFRSDRLDAVDSGDPAFPSGSDDGSGLDIGAGLLYQCGIFHVGLSAQHLTSPVITYGKGEGAAELRIGPAFYFQTGCNIQLRNPLLSLQPSVQACSDLGTYRVDMTLRGTYRYNGNSYYCGLTYCPGTSVTFLLGACIRQVTVGYAYELFTNGIGWQTGSHDLVLGYRFDVDFFKKGKNVHKSVRYL